jgi:ParB family transcriptional regulator, chromosome partitioning protein
MNKRKDQLKSLFATPTAEMPAVLERKSLPPEPVADQPEPARRAPSGAVKAMGLSLGALSDEVAEARRLKLDVGNGERIIEIDPADIDSSPFADRLTAETGDDQFEALKESVRERGQQVPVLLRPHPDGTPDRYQSAYGHRRIQVARELGIKVRAIVRPLTDVELMIAQGKENSERRDLSFIERAMFANALLRHGFERGAIRAALGVHNTEMSRLLQAAELVPYQYASGIGPAPKIGRARWLELGEILRGESKQVIAWDEITSERFRKVPDSNRRFEMVIRRLKGRAPARAERQAVRAESGTAIAELSARGTATVVTIPATAGAGFADFVAAELPRLHAAFLAKQRN